MRNLLDGFSDFRAVAERCFAVDVPDVVQIDIDGKPREMEIKEVESRSALESKLSPEVGMFVEFSKELAMRLVDRVLRLAVEVDVTGEVEDVILVEMDTAGTVTETYRIPLDNEAGKVTALQLKSVELGPPQVEPLAAQESEAEKKNARHVRSK